MGFLIMFGTKKGYKVMNIGNLKIKNYTECLNYQMIFKLLILLNQDQKKLNLETDAKVLANVDGLPFALLFDFYVYYLKNVKKNFHCNIII